MDEATAQFLVREEGQQLLSEVTALPGDDTTRLLALRKKGYSLEIAGGAVEVIAARHRGRRRFPDADRLFFTADTLAQATSPGIAAYHAAQLAPLGTIADLGCGAGIDSIALAEAGANVLALDRDLARLVFAQANAEARNVADRITFRAADVTTEPWEADAAYWDPARRNDDRHRFSRYGDRYEPPLSFLDTVRMRVSRGGCIKLSPALPNEALAELGDGYLEFLSEDRECKEACFWFGEAQGAAGDQSGAAVLLPERIVVPANEVLPPVASSLGLYVHDPDPALIRAGALGSIDGVSCITADDAYLTSDALLPSPRLGRSYRILESMIYRPKELSAWLRKESVGRLVIKKRHFPKEPATVLKELGMSGKGNELTLIIVQDGKRFWAILCEPATA